MTDLECHHNTYTSGNVFFGDGQQTPPYISTNSDGHERSITINHCCLYEMVTVTICHYNQYSWRTLNVTMTPIHFVTFSFWWRRLWSITISHMKWQQYLSIIINHYFWRTLSVTTTHIFLATPPLVTFIFWWRRLWFVTITNMKWWQSLSVIINNYWWWNLNVTKTPILLMMPSLVMKALLIVTNELMVTFFSPHQCPFFL